VTNAISILATNAIQITQRGAEKNAIACTRKSLRRSRICEILAQLICPSGTSHKILSSFARKNIYLPFFGNQCV
jgi:hypothetical protein